MVGSDDEFGNEPEAMRNFCLTGERDLERLGVGGRFLKSIRGISFVGGKRGTDCALAFVGEAVGEYTEGRGPALTVELGFLLVVADRFRVHCLDARVYSELPRACLAVRRCIICRDKPLSTAISSPLLTRLNSRPSDKEPGACKYSSSDSGDTERLEPPAFFPLESGFLGERSNSSVPSEDSIDVDDIFV
jgi:hypothetical protein